MLLTHCANTIRNTCWHMNVTLIAGVWIRNPLSIRLRRVRKRRELRELLPYHHQVLPILKIPFPLLDQVTLPWTAMETIKVVTQAAHPVVSRCRRSTRLRHLDHPVKVVHHPLIKGYNKVVTRTRAPIRTIRKNSIFGRRQTRCLSKQSSINRTRPDHIILHMYRMSTGDTRVVTCRRTTLLDRTCTTDTPAVNRALLAIPQERLLARGAIAIRRDRRLIRPLCNNKRRLASLPRPRNRQLCRHTRVRKTTIDRNKVDTERLVELRYILEADRRTKTCHHPLRDLLNLDATQILPKTNSIPTNSIINNDQRIQDGQIQLINTIVIVETTGFSTQLSRHHRHRNHLHLSNRNKPKSSPLLHPLQRSPVCLVVNNGLASNRAGPRLNRL